MQENEVQQQLWMKVVLQQGYWWC